MTRLRVAHTHAAASFVALLGVFCAASCFVRCTHSRPRLRVYSKAEAGHAAPPPRTSIEWDDLGFGLTTKDTQMVVATCPRNGEWNSFKVEPYGALSLEPAATVLNYGQGIFEGLKAFRTSKGRTVLFRPEKNAQRMASGAERFLMPPVPKELFLEMCYEAVRANADWVPPEGKGSLYLRPLLMGSGAALGVGPSPEFTFVIYVAPVGSYFSGGGARLRVETSHHRAADLGVGYVKAAGNYAPCFQPQKDAKEKGFSDVLYLDPSGKRVEEAAASNFFCVTKDGKLKTPALGTILAGVTRDSILQLARRLATQSDLINSVEETSITLDEILQAKEAFVTGTAAAAVTPVGHVASDDGSVDLEVPGPVTAKLKETFQELQQELQPDEEGWLVDVFA